MFFEDSIEVNAVVDDCRTESSALQVRLEMLFEGLAAYAEVRHCFLRIETALAGHDYPRWRTAAIWLMKRFNVKTK